MKWWVLVALFSVGCGDALVGGDAGTPPEAPDASAPFSCYIDPDGGCRCDVNTATWNATTFQAMLDWCSYLKTLSQ